MNASSHGCGPGRTTAPVGSMSGRRTYIQAASNASSSATPSTSRRNHGCQPTHAGIGSSASTVRVASSPSAARRIACVTRPRNGQPGPRSISRVAASVVREVTAQVRSNTVPWIACGAMLTGSWCVRPRNVNRPSPIRPANGTIGSSPTRSGRRPR